MGGEDLDFVTLDRRCLKCHCLFLVCSFGRFVVK
jgi:hypothetical protein